MEDLNRNISGLNTIYEIQLKGVSSQLDSIDRVNRGLKDIRDMYEKSARESSRYCEETEKMARCYQAAQPGLREDDHRNDHQHV